MAFRQDGVESPGGIGARLRRARERNGLSQIQAAERLHLDPMVLQALEAEQFERLGAPVYVRGYIRHYADLVRESAAELEDLYGSSTHASRKPDLTHIPKVAHSRSQSTLVAPGIIVVSAVALIGSGWWVAGALSRSAKVRRIAAPATASQPAASSALKARSLAVKRPLPFGVSSRGISSAAPGERLAPFASLEMHFTGSAWVEVYDARGKRLIYDNAQAGSTRTVRGLLPLTLVLGNAPAVSLELDGKALQTPVAARNGVLELRIGRSGRVKRIGPLTHARVPGRAPAATLRRSPLAVAGTAAEENGGKP